MPKRIAFLLAVAICVVGFEAPFGALTAGHAQADSRTRFGSSGPGLPMTRTRLVNASAATMTWAMAIAPTGRPIRGRNSVNSAAPIAIPIRNVPRIIVNT